MHRRPRAPRSSLSAPLAASILLALSLSIGAVSGCAKPLLSPTDERTPFDRYDALRNQYARQYVENEFGGQEPNLRGRLAPK